MFLKQQINEHLKQAMREGDISKRDALRMLVSMIKNAEIEKKKQEKGLDDAEVREVISRAIKQRRDSIEQFKSGGRMDLVDKENKEIETFLLYMPAQITEDEIRKTVKDVIIEVKAESVSDIGRVMGRAMQKLKGQADGNIVKRIAQEELTV